MTLDDLIERLTELRDDALGLGSADVRVELPVDEESNRAPVQTITVETSLGDRHITLRGGHR